MKLKTKLAIKMSEGDPGFLAVYARENFEMLSFLEVDNIAHEIARSGSAETICFFAHLLNKNGYNNGNIDLLADGLLKINKNVNNQIECISEFICTVDGISDKMLEKLKYELDCLSEYDEVDVKTLSDVYYELEDKLNENEKDSLMFLICEKQDFKYTLDIFDNAKMTKEQREQMIEYMHDTLCIDMKNEEDKKEAINLILDQYNEEELVELNKKRSFDYDFEKDSMIYTCIAASTPNIIYGLMFSNYDFDESHITRMIYKLISKEEYKLLIDIVESKAYTAGIKNDLSDKDIDKIISAVCGTYSSELIYRLADVMNGCLTEKQKLRIRRSMFKSNDPDTIVKYSLDIDNEAVPAKFKTVEKFYNYVDENMTDEKEKQDVKEEILNPRTYKLTNE